jgi:histidine triad (HIT) family protein
MSDDTIFDKILRKEIPADVVYEDDEVLAFRDINPQAPTHVLVIPKQKWTSFAQFRESDPAAIGRYMMKISDVANQLELESSGYRVVFNHGKDGQQSVNYIHAHIIGGRGLKWPPG